MVQCNIKNNNLVNRNYLINKESKPLYVQKNFIQLAKYTSLDQNTY